MLLHIVHFNKSAYYTYVETLYLIKQFFLDIIIIILLKLNLKAAILLGIKNIVLLM